jgi:hypothetical protein
MEKAKPRLVIVCEGGLVREVFCDQELDIAIVDYDVDGVNGEWLTKINGEVGSVSRITGDGPIPHAYDEIFS